MIDWDKVLIETSIAAMQGIQESGKLGLAADVMPEELAKLSVRIAKYLIEELKKDGIIPFSLVKCELYK